MLEILPPDVRDFWHEKILPPIHTCREGTSQVVNNTSKFMWTFQVYNGVYIDVSLFVPLHMKRWLEYMVRLKHINTISIFNFHRR